MWLLSGADCDITLLWNQLDQRVTMLFKFNFSSPAKFNNKNTTVLKNNLRIFFLGFLCNHFSCFITSILCPLCVIYIIYTSFQSQYSSFLRFFPFQRSVWLGSVGYSRRGGHSHSRGWGKVLKRKCPTVSAVKEKFVVS